ncbi:MAG: DUF2911 domain-containing protein [Gemmatimonadota bacterium]
MFAPRMLAVAAMLGLAACANAAPADDQPAPGNGQLVTQPVVPLECTPSERMPVEGRASPYDAVTVDVGSRQLRICYGRPAARGRVIFGGLVPYGQLWRTGANEPTILHLAFPAEIAGIRVEPGSYSLYTVPSADEWTLVINRSTSQWGHESSYTPEIEAQEVGRAAIPTERLDQHVELFTIRGETSGTGADVLLEWERTRARIPVRPIGSS